MRLHDEPDCNELLQIARNPLMRPPDCRKLSTVRMLYVDLYTNIKGVVYASRLHEAGNEIR